MTPFDRGFIMFQSHNEPKPQAISLAHKASLIDQLWTPRVIAEMNDYQFKVVRIEGEFIWHSHPETDEVFFVIEGTLRIDMPHGCVYVGQGELYVVPRGVEHRTAAEGEARLMMIEPRGVLNTGHEGGERTASNDVWI
jgi:mannose-6-phosphate isomerase-like protein (cupin superfamily)